MSFLSRPPAGEDGSPSRCLLNSILKSSVHIEWFISSRLFRPQRTICNGTDDWKSRLTWSPPASVIYLFRTGMFDTGIGWWNRKADEKNIFSIGEHGFYDSVKCTGSWNSQSRWLPFTFSHNPIYISWNFGLDADLGPVYPPCVQQTNSASLKNFIYLYASLWGPYVRPARTSSAGLWNGFPYDISIKRPFLPAHLYMSSINRWACIQLIR